MRTEKASLHPAMQLGRLRPEENPDASSFPFHHFVNLVHCQSWQSVDVSAWPTDFNIRLLRCAETEMDAQIILRNVAAAAANLVHLAMLAGCADDARTNAGAIRLCANAFQFDPVVAKRAIATK